MDAIAAMHSSDWRAPPPNSPSRSGTTSAIGSASLASPNPFAVGATPPECKRHRFCPVTELKHESDQTLREFDK